MALFWALFSGKFDPFHLALGLGSCLIVAAFSSNLLFYISTGSLNMEDLRLLLPSVYASRVIQAAFVFIFIGFAIKIALFPMHAWQPDVYIYAPSAVSVIISTAAAKTFCYALIRIIYSVFTLNFIKAFLPVIDFICWIAALAMIGMPPSAGFITKWYLILAALEAGNYIFVAVIFFSTLLMIIYFWRVIEIMYIRVETEADETAADRVQEAPLSMLVPGQSIRPRPAP